MLKYESSELTIIGKLAFIWNLDIFFLYFGKRFIGINFLVLETNKAPRTSSLNHVTLGEQLLLIRDDSQD